MVQKLGDADWQNVDESSPAENVYQYVFTVDGAPVYVAWYDWFNGTESSTQVTLNVSAISTAQAKVTKAVPHFGSGKKADTVPFEEAFTIYTLPITAGSIDITLGKKPVFIEEYGTF